MYHQYDEIAENIKVNSRYGIILTIHSNLETICRNIISQLNEKASVNETNRDRNFFKNFKRFLDELLNISHSEYQLTYNKICSFYKIRNFIAHGNGWIPKNKKDGLGPVESIFKGISIKKYNSEYYKLEIIDSSFLYEASNTVCTFISKIGSLVEENIES
jgi:hypothetical protein